MKTKKQKKKTKNKKKNEGGPLKEKWKGGEKEREMLSREENRSALVLKKTQNIRGRRSWEYPTVIPLVA